ncbi:unnamed protein product [Paramecium sonneborni]|uniref:Uncharacterized protein n=1 Tax=Paramecium sonneborni TaxID=65129 RepID=A0A8S1N893_9CILI|nr:unnamed protein product [Paramecium sonneborni]
MGCLEFWVVNSFLAALTFFVLFLVIDTQYPLYPYAVAGGQLRDNSKSATACIVAAALYIFIGLGLLLWQKSREHRIEKERQYTSQSKQSRTNFDEKIQSQPSFKVKGPQLEL